MEAGDRLLWRIMRREPEPIVAVEIFYETHSTTIDNESGIATGWLPGKLSENGREQARALGERRRGDDIAAVFVFDRARAVEIAFGGSDVPIYQDARLRECNYGVMNGISVAQLAAGRYRHVDEPWPQGQSCRQVVAQARDFLRDLATGWDDRTVVVIAHAAKG